MDNRPIAVFDSGYGGLTAYRALRELMPDENIIYFADSGRAPYGSRPEAQIRAIARQNLDFAAGLGAKAVLAACGTVSSVAQRELKESPVPCLGVISCAARAAAAAAPVGARIGIAATAATVNSRVLENMILSARPDCTVVGVACPDFVTLIENGHMSCDDPQVCEAVARALAPLKAQGVQQLILGCTHFGLIGDAIQAFMGPQTVLLEVSLCAAEAVAEYLRSSGLAGNCRQSRFFTSGDAREFSRTAAILTGEELTAEHVIPLEV